MPTVKSRLLARAACLLSAGLLLAQPAGGPAGAARKAVDLLLAGKYPELEQMFAPNLKESMKLEALNKLGAEVKTWGAVENIGTPDVRPSGSGSVVTVPVKFATQNINFMMGVSAAGELTGFFMRPGEVAWQHPAYSKPDSFKERAVSVGDDPYKLPGTLTVPNGTGPFPAVVLVHGTGPNDRDETVGAVKMFKDLAEGLASRGIAVLRYEKRTRLYQSKMSAKPYTADDETVDDAQSAIDFLRTQPEINGKKIYVVGHSLGGYMAPRIAAGDEKPAGIVILASNARPLEDVLVEQAASMNLTPQDVANLKSAAAKVKKLDTADEDQPNVLGLPVAYWVDLKGYDPVAEAKKLGIPVMVLQGERDFQVSMKDFNTWKSGGFTAKSYPALNHLFVAGEGKSTDAEYRKPGHVAPEVIDQIASFVTK